MAKTHVTLKNNIANENKKITNQALRAAKQQVYITFNWSFLTNNNNYNILSSGLTDEQMRLLMNRIHDLSKLDLISITANSSKRLGLEKIPYDKLGKTEKLKKLNMHADFISSVRDGLAGKDYWVFRLCPNNNPYPTRIIGKMIDDIFYVLFIDLHHELYAKRK